MATIQEKIFRHALKGSKKYFANNPEEILKLLDRSDIEEHASWELSMVKKEDVNDECTLEHLDECSDSEILCELSTRGIKLQGDNLITSDLVNRFAKIVELDNPIKLTSIIQQLEKENNL